MLYIYFYSLLLSPQTAILGDYVELDDSLVTFNSGLPTTQWRNITIVDDDVVESLESFSINLEAVSKNVQIKPNSSAIISITDNDGE